MSKPKTNYLKKYARPLINAGHQITPIRDGYKYPKGVKNWHNLKQDKATISKYFNDKYTGVGIMTGATRGEQSIVGIDIDCLDEGTTKNIVKYCTQTFGETVERIGLYPKSLLIFRSKTKIKKLASLKYESAFGETAQLEILGDGQMCVAYGYHPETKEPYYYPNKDLLDIKIEDLPEVTEDQLIELIRYFEQHLESHPDFEPITESKFSFDQSSNIDFLNNVKAPLDLSVAKIHKILDGISSDNYDTWIKMGMALYHQFSGSEEGYKVWLEWSEKSSKFKAQEMPNKWKSFAPDENRTETITLASFVSRSINLSPSIDPKNPVAWTKKFEISNEEAEAIANPEWLIENLIISGHYTVIVAEPNAGKTTIVFHLACEMANTGLDVFYVNADISGGDAKYFHEIAREESTLTLLLPDLSNNNVNMDNIVQNLEKMAKLPNSYQNTVFIFDTLKKMTDVINKSSAKKLYQLLRKLTGKEMTVVALGHTNKHKDSDGQLVYEGTGDLRSDCDNLIYFIPEKINNKLVVTTKPDKKRGTHKPISFEIDEHRNVKQLQNIVPTEQHRLNKSEFKKFSEAIEAIDSAIENKQTTQKEIIDYAHNQFGIGSSKVRRVLERFRVEKQDLRDIPNRDHSQARLWLRQPTGVNNHQEYSKLPEASDFDEFDDVDYDFA